MEALLKMRLSSSAFEGLRGCQGSLHFATRCTKDGPQEKSRVASVGGENMKARLLPSA